MVLTMPLNLTVTAVALALAIQAAQPPRKVNLHEYLRMAFEGLKADLLAAAEAMAETDYGFKPTTMPEVRTL